MPAKPVAIFCAFGVAAAFSLASLQPVAAGKPAPPTILLYAASPADVTAMADLRTRLRLDGQLQVLTYDTESAIVQRIAAETSHPEWLVGPALTDDTRLALARALGVTYYAVISPGRGADSTHIQLVETAPTARIFDWVGVNRQYGAHAIESQAVLALPAADATLIASAPLPVVASAPLPAVASVTLPVIAPAALPVMPQIVIAKPVVTLPAPVVAAVPVPAMKPVLPPFIQVARLPQEVPTFALPLLTPTVQAVVPVPIRSAAPNSEAGVPLPFPTQARAADLSGITSLLRKGDSALLGGDIVGAISSYRKAVNGAPLSVIPRLKLAQAYQKGGMSEKSLDEARRALEIAPDSLSVQQFLTQLDTDNGTSDGAMTRYRAMLDRNPADPAAHTGLAEALWNSGDIPGAEAEYKAAKKFAPAGNHSADAHLAQLYASQARYDECLAALSDSGKDGYALAIRIVKNRADTFSSTVDASREGFAGGKSTREQFYDGAKKVSAQSQALAAFVAKIVPPPEFRLSHLHRMLAANLLAQEAATLVTFIETGDAKLGDGVSQLDKEVQMEMLTARAAEEKHGMWEVNKVEATKIEANQ